MELTEKTVSEKHVETVANKLADELCRKINNLHFSEQIIDDVKYPCQLTLETIINILKQRV